MYKKKEKKWKRRVGKGVERSYLVGYKLYAN